MAANASDMFQKVARSTATTLSAPGYTVGATSINVASTSNWPADTGITFGIDEVDGGGNRIAGTYNIFRGTVGSATQLANLTYVGGDANRNYSAGATTRVYILVSYARENRLVDGLLVSHDQDGTLKNDIVTTPKIADGAVTPAKLSTSPSNFGLQEIARTTLSSASDTITVSSIPAKKHLKIIIATIATGGTIDTSFRFNNDSSTVYRMQYNTSANPSLSVDTTAVASLPIESGMTSSGNPSLAIIDLYNPNAVYKSGNIVTSSYDSILSWLRGAFRYASTTQVTRIDVTNAGTGDFAIGSEIIVLGTD